VADPIVSRINVVYLYVRDLGRSVAFYRDLLGIPLEGDEDWAEATLPGGVRFALHATSDAGELGSGTLQVDLEVADLVEAVERLRGAGIRVGEIERDFWGGACDFLDPDGYRLQLYQPNTSGGETERS
jgi:catechol 2,3-dioxygenase-like lactoylglutathione lyase family enzyme